MDKHTLKISRSQRLLDAALYYLRELGWSVIPIKPRDKTPLVAWEQYQHEPATEEQILQWWTEHPNANIGIVTGAVSGIVALDIDGTEGAQSLEQQPELEPTPFSNTSKGGHYFFRHPGDGELRNFARKLPGLDFRGDGGYIVAPPSVHPSGHVYTWGLWPHQQPPADLPGWLRELMSSNSHTPLTLTPPTEAERIAEGGRNDALARLAGSMRRKGFSREAIEAALQEENRMKCDPPLPQVEVREIARSVGRYEPSMPVNGKSSKEENTRPLPLPVCMADVQDAEIDWLWFPRIPVGFLTALEGDPGEGKSFIGCALATAISLGRGLPGTEETTPGHVLLLTAEDHLGATIKKRLRDMGADLNRIMAISEAFALDDTGLQHLETLILSLSVRLIILDPIVAFLSAELDLHRANEVRAILSRLAHMAEAYLCAIVIIRHLSKGTASKNIYRGQGSIDFTAACRSVLLAGHDPDDQNNRALVQIKSNLGPMADPLGYSIEEGLFRWTGGTNLTAGQLLASEMEASVLGDAKTLLSDLLADGPRGADEISEEAKSAGISTATLRRAKAALGVKSRRDGQKGGWIWEIPKG